MDHILQATAQRAARILSAFVRDHAARLRWGMRQREGLIKKMQAGQDVGGSYRVQWVRETAARLMVDLRDAARAFDARYPWDAASQEDIKDVVKNLYASLE